MKNEYQDRIEIQFGWYKQNDHNFCIILTNVQNLTNAFELKCLMKFVKRRVYVNFEHIEWRDRKMRTLIVPCAGSRKIGNEPLFLNRHPDNKLLVLKSIEGIHPEKYDKIIITILTSDNEKYHAMEKINNANKDKYVIEFVLLDYPTKGPAETVYRTIVEAEVRGEFAVRDSHAYIGTKKYYEGNFVAGLDLTKYEKTIDNLRSKSFIIINEQGQILDIVEKHFCADVISVGFYGFKNVDDFKTAYEHLCDPNYGIQKLYLSHVISYLIGYKQRIFHSAEVIEFEDWSTSIAWQHVQKKNSLCFIDMDRIQFNDVVKRNLKKMSRVGMSFIGYSYNNVKISDYDTEEINLLEVVSNCPITNSKEIISNLEDIERLLLEV